MKKGWREERKIKKDRKGRGRRKNVTEAQVRNKGKRKEGTRRERERRKWES